MVSGKKRNNVRFIKEYFLRRLNVYIKKIILFLFLRIYMDLNKYRNDRLEGIY